MADTAGAGKDTRGKMPMGIALIVSVALAVMGWALTAQSMAKDAGHDVLRLELSNVEDTVAELKVSSERRDVQIAELQKDMSKALTIIERIERKLP